MNRRLTLPLLLLLGLFALSAPAASASLTGFQSEDGKVGCYLTGKGVRCDVKKPRWDPPPKPPECDLDWGQGVTVSRQGPAEYVCAGDTTLNPDHEVLESGDKIERGRFKCKALNQSLIKCINTRNREGFEVSRFEVHVFE